MFEELRAAADEIVAACIEEVLPDAAVERALEYFYPGGGRTIVVAAGKAAWQMAAAAQRALDHIDAGIVITKYGHARGPLAGFDIYEAGHPLPDANSVAATTRALKMTSGLSEDDTVIFLVSGGASALFERPYLPIGELRDITSQLLASGADIVEANTVRKRLSMVKGGRFAEHCAPAQVYGIALSDVMGNRPDMIASGPVSPDPSTCAEALAVAQKRGLRLSPDALEQLQVETPKEIDNATLQVAGSVGELCQAGVKAARKLGYKPLILTDRLDCEAREAGRMLGSIAATQADHNRKLALFAGGETVVHVTGTGTGGRNQELALAAAPYLDGKRAAVFSFGSDGTDGPTDAAGGYVDGRTALALRRAGIDGATALSANDSNPALAAVDGLIVTGPTGTNVCDLACALIG